MSSIILLMHMFIHSGESKGDQNVQQNHLPQHIRLRSTLLVNIRPTSKIQV